VEDGDVELLGAQAASTADLIGIEASPQQKDTGMTSPVDINGIEASNSREVQGCRYGLK
jgi:hypothetical protein